MPNRTEAYNQAITDLKAAPKDYEKLALLWSGLVTDRFTKALQKRYEAAALTEDQLKNMVEVEVTGFRASLTDEEFRKHLDDLHNSAVSVGVNQLEHERDNPDHANEPAPDTRGGDQILTAIGTFAVAAATWIADRILDNIEGAKNEPGVVAQVLRGSIGISITDIGKNGVMGGENSYLRKVVPTWSDDGGFFGGDNSFFRKLFG